MNRTVLFVLSKGARKARALVRADRDHRVVLDEPFFVGTFRETFRWEGRDLPILPFENDKLSIGEDRRLADKWFFNTIFRDAGYYRNPNWALSSGEKKAYVEEVITDEYNVNRAKNAVTSDKKTERVKQRVLSRDAAGLMRDIRFDAFKTKVYDFYSRTLRRKLKRG